jgi:hypothetical protein
MKEKEFDNLIRSRLKNHESPVPTGMWERITVKERNRKKGFPRRLYLLIIVFLSIGLAGIWYSSGTHDPAKNDFVSNKESTKNTREEKNLIQPNNKDDGSLSTAHLPKYRNPGRTDNVTSDKHHKKNNPVTKADKARKNTSNNTREVLNSGDDVVRSNNDQKTPGDAQGASNNSVKQNAKESSANKPGPEATGEMRLSEYESDKFSVELFTSPTVPINSISSDNIAYEHALKRSGNMQLSYTIGAKFSYSVSKKLSAKTGVQYSQVNEKMNFDDSAGNKFTSNNRYKNIGIPLVIGYRIVSANNLHVSLNTGIIVNVVSTYKGIIPSPGTGQPIDIKNENVYNTNATADLYFGVNLSKKMNSRTDFFAEPWINYRFKNMVSHYYSFDQKINTLGLSIGLRYRLYKNETEQ